MSKRKKRSRKPSLWKRALLLPLMDMQINLTGNEGSLIRDRIEELRRKKQQQGEEVETLPNLEEVETLPDLEEIETLPDLEEIETLPDLEEIETLLDLEEIETLLDLEEDRLDILEESDSDDSDSTVLTIYE